MKKLVYFLSITLFIVSCGMSSNIHDDVYDKTQTKALAVVDVENGYSDYIKKEESKYKIEPENKNDKKFIYSSGSNELSSTYNDNEHFCFHHQQFHSIHLRSFFCDFNTFEFPNNDNRYYNGFDYGGQVCNINSPYNGDFNHFGNSWAYQGMYPGFYNPYGNNGYGYYAGFGIWNYGYGGNYFGNNGLSGASGFGNSYPINIPSSSEGNNSVSSGYSYGHRGNGSSSGTTLNNNTFYPETVKVEMQKPNVNTFPVVSSNHVAIASQNVAQEQVIINNNIVASNPSKVEKETGITANPVTQLWGKPEGKTNNSFNNSSSNYANYENKYETTLMNTETTNTTTVRTTDTSRRNYNTNNSTNSSKTYGSRSTGGTTGSSSTSGSISSSGSRSGSSRR